MAAATGIPARTLRTWAADGDVASQPPGLGERGRRVNREEVLQVARTRGRIVAVAAATPPPSVPAVSLPEQPLGGNLATAIATLQTRVDAFSATYSELPQALDRLHLDALNLTVAVDRQTRDLARVGWVLVATFAAGFGAVVVALLAR